MTDTAVSKPGDIRHIEIPAKDLETARMFYSTVFGWTIQRNTPSSAYWFFDAGNVAGAFDAGRTPSDDGVCLILEVDDIPSTLDRIVRLGGEQLADKSALPDELGYIACFRDPNGVRMELWSKT
ncbi:VOC family protein [Candidatus Bipolaricaulota bacterium]